MLVAATGAAPVVNVQAVLPVTVPIAQTQETVSFQPRQTGWIDVHIQSVEGVAPTAVGFSEISFPGLDLREFVRTPDDVFRAEHTRLNVAVNDAPTTSGIANQTVLEAWDEA